MPKGIYAAASAMVVETRSLEVTSRNLANVQTTGYRHETALRTSFAEVMKNHGANGTMATDGGTGILPHGSYFGFQDGSKEATGAPLDVALTGEGFFRVKDDQGKVLLTRAGHFVSDASGRLQTQQGWSVEGQGGPITIPADARHVVIDKSGRVIAQVINGGKLEDQTIDQLRIVKVDKPTNMMARNGQYFDPGNQLQDDAKVEVSQGYLEHANVDSIRELVDMVAIQRRYDAAQRALKEQANVGGGLSEMLRGVS